jgi:hypothetical protein
MNGPAYFARAVSYASKIFMKLTIGPVDPGTKATIKLLSFVTYILNE